jgi:choline monooxygenase
MTASSAQSSPVSTDSLNTTILPASWFYDSVHYAREQELLFERSWIHVGHASRIPNPGDYIICEVGSQSIIMLRDKRGEVGAFYNVCRHRATQLLQGEGTVARIFCPYHGWTYDLRGRLVVARNSENVPGFDKSCWGLRPVRLERIAGFLFVCLDPDTPSMAGMYGGLADDVWALEPEIEHLVHAHQMVFDIASNWKIATENFLEAYHVRIVHPAMYEAFDMGAYAWEMHDYYTNLTTVANLDEKVSIYDWNESERTDLPGYWVWPMFMFERMPGRAGLFTYNHLPKGPERTLCVVDFYFVDPELTEEDHREIAYVDQIRREDVVSLEAVQRGIRSKGWGKGPYMMGPDASAECTEAALLHFHRIIKRYLEPDGNRGRTG